VNKKDLKLTLSEIEAIARGRGGRLDARLWPPAEAEDIALCEHMIGVNLPASMKTFLSHTGGMNLEVIGSNEICKFELSVFSIAHLIVAIVDLSRFFEMTGLEWYTQERARNYLEFSSQGDVDWRTLLDFTRWDPITAECPIIFISESDTQWMLGPQEPIASTFDEFLEKSLRFMVRTEGGFVYHAEPAPRW
jgi:hypothetical protein